MSLIVYGHNLKKLYDYFTNLINDQTEVELDDIKKNYKIYCVSLYLWNKCHYKFTVVHNRSHRIKKICWAVNQSTRFRTIVNVNGIYWVLRCRPQNIQPHYPFFRDRISINHISMSIKYAINCNFETVDFEKMIQREIEQI